MSVAAGRADDPEGLLVAGALGVDFFHPLGIAPVGLVGVAEREPGAVGRPGGRRADDAQSGELSRRRRPVGVRDEQLQAAAEYSAAERGPSGAGMDSRTGLEGCRRVQKLDLDA